MLVWIICEDDEINKYKYICYSECTKGTYTLKNNKYLYEKNINNCIQKYPFIFREDESSSEICNSEDFFNKKSILNIHNESYNFIIENIINGIEINNEKIIILWMYFWRDFTYYYYLLSYQI